MGRHANHDYAALEAARPAGVTKREWAEEHGVLYPSYRRATRTFAATKRDEHVIPLALSGEEAPSSEKPSTPIMPPHRPKAPRRFMRVGVFDIETQSFDAIGEDGVFTCGCILPLDDDKIITSRLEFKDRGDDRRVLVEFIGELWKFDLLIGHNISAFDLNWLNTRRMYHGMPDLRSWLVFDTYQASRAIAMSSGGKSLGNLEDVFGLEGVKTTIRKTTWSKARSQNREVFEATLAQTIYHCEQDVIGQRELFDVLMPYAMTLPTSQFKQSKWKLGVPSWEAWMAQWKIAQRELKEQHQNIRLAVANAAK